MREAESMWCRQQKAAAVKFQREKSVSDEGDLERRTALLTDNYVITIFYHGVKTLLQHTQNHNYSLFYLTKLDSRYITVRDYPAASISTRPDPVVILVLNLFRSKSSYRVYWKKTWAKYATSSIVNHSSHSFRVRCLHIRVKIAFYIKHM